MVIFLLVVVLEPGNLIAFNGAMEMHPPPCTRLQRPLARDPRVLAGWPFPLGFGLGERLLLARRGRVYV